MNQTALKLFETIRIQDGKPMHLNYHNQRLNQSRKALFGMDTPIDISDYLTEIPPKGLYRAKLIYGKEIEKPYYYIYKAKIIEKIGIIEANITYDYKYLDRSKLENLLMKDDGYDEVLISRNGLLSDTTIANIALHQNGQWFTPAIPLLPGTTRARLLSEGKLITRDIYYTDLEQYDGFALMNAMIGFSVQKEIPTFLIPHS